MYMKSVFAGLAAAFLATSAAASTIVSFDFTGQGVTNFGTVIGTNTVSGTITYDTGVAPTASIPTAARFATGTVEFTTVGGAYSGTTYILSSHATDVSERAFQMNAGASEGTIFSIENGTPVFADFSSLPTTLDLSDFDGSRVFSISGADIGFVGGPRVEYRITSLTQTQFVTPPQPPAVPLPAGLPLLLAGLGALAVMRRRT